MSLLRLHNYCNGRHGHPYSAIATGYEDGTDDTTASKDCTIDEPDFIVSYKSKAEIYKCVDFLGTANRGFRKTLTIYTHLASFLLYASSLSQTLPRG